jgi:hypothetical protein
MALTTTSAALVVLSTRVVVVVVAKKLRTPSTCLLRDRLVLSESLFLLLWGTRSVGTKSAKAISIDPSIHRSQRQAVSGSAGY